jgi:hypothetical protein
LQGFPGQRLRDAVLQLLGNAQRSSSLARAAMGQWNN